MLLSIAPSDAQIHRDVLQELARDRRVAEMDVGVDVCDGVVRLMGTVTSYVAKRAAQEAAHRVPGVRAVGNDIAVRTPGARIRTSADIARAARCALERDVLVPNERIRTTVTDGWVTLEGQVDRAHQRDDAEWAVRHLAGVRGVMNRLTVRAPDTSDAMPRTLSRRRTPEMAEGVHAAAQVAARRRSPRGVHAGHGQHTDMDKEHRCHALRLSLDHRSQPQMRAQRP